jgi:hypothetical protein
MSYDNGTFKVKVKLKFVCKTLTRSGGSSPACHQMPGVISLFFYAGFDGKTKAEAMFSTCNAFFSKYLLRRYKYRVSNSIPALRHFVGLLKWAKFQC